MATAQGSRGTKCHFPIQNYPRDGSHEVIASRRHLSNASHPAGVHRLHTTVSRMLFLRCRRPFPKCALNSRIHGSKQFSGQQETFFVSITMWAFARHCWIKQLVMMRLVAAFGPVLPERSDVTDILRKSVKMTNLISL